MPKFLAVIFMGVASIWHGMFGAHAPINNNSQYGNQYGQNRPANPNGNSMIGTVSSINGTSIVMQVIQRPNPTSTTTASVDFTVDASNARIIKSGATTTATISNISIGDRIIAQGTIDGNSIAAKLVIDTLPIPQVQKPVVTPAKTPAKVVKPTTKSTKK